MHVHVVFNWNLALRLPDDPPACALLALRPGGREPAVGLMQKGWRSPEGVGWLADRQVSRAAHGGLAPVVRPPNEPTYDAHPTKSGARLCHVAAF